MRYKILPHTADLRLKIYGKDLAELFQNAALGLANILNKNAEKKLKFVRGTEKVAAEADSAENLLVNFLNQILAVSNINKKVYPRVKILYFSPRKVEAQISGISVRGFDKDVKAVSFHNVKIDRRGAYFEATLTLDI